MWPWGHAAVGYLLYSFGIRERTDQPPAPLAALAVVFGTQVSDLVDKPLAWSFGVLPTGRSLAHSLLIIVPIVLVLWWIWGDRHGDVVAAFGLGWISHPFADGVGILFGDDFAYFGYMGWPITSTPPYETDPSFLAHFLGIELTPHFIGQWILAAIALAVWRRDGYPGLHLVLSRLGLPTPEPAKQ